MFFWLRIVFIFVFFFKTCFAEELIKGEGYELRIYNSGSSAVVSLKAEEGVKFYWRNPGEIGLATKFDLTDSINLKTSKIYWPIPQLDDVDELQSYVYKGKKDFVIYPVAENNDQEIDLKVKLSFAICKDYCSSHQHNLSVFIDPKLGETAEVIQLKENAPKLNGTIKIERVTQENTAENQLIRIKFSSEFKQQNPELFLDLPDYVRFDPKKINFYYDFDEQIFDIPIIFNEKKHIDKIYFNIIADNGEAIEYEYNNIKEESFSWLYVILYAFIGGLILNIMPCVLPIIGIKVYQLLGIEKNDKFTLRKSLLAQSMGIIISFTSFAVISYILRLLGNQVGFGLHFQQPLYLITMVIILSLVAINLIEKVNIRLFVPNFITSKFDSKRQDLLGFFLSGVLVTMLAIPCTAPFITIAIGFALTGNFLEMLIIFTVIGLGMALPYLMLALIPSSGKLFPKPGKWIEKFKKFVGLLVFASAIWLIYVLYTQLGLKAALILFFLIILLKFVIIDKEIFSNKTKIILSSLIIILCYFMPQGMYEEKKQEDMLIENVWREYNPSQIKTLIEKGYVVIVDVTASWCTTCVINKMTTLDTSTLLSYMKTREIIGMRADISSGNTEEVTKLMKDKKHFGIPLTIIYSKRYPEGLVLPTILSKKKMINALKEVS